MTHGLKSIAVALVLACFSSIGLFHCGQHEGLDEDVDQIECLDESGLDLKIEIPGGNTSFRWGAPIDLLVSLCNCGDSFFEVRPMLVPQYHFIRIYVKDSEFEDLVFLGPHWRLAAPPYQKLLPGECMWELFHRDGLFEFDHLDRYTVTAEYFDPMPSSHYPFIPMSTKIIVLSNVLTIDIDGPKESGDTSKFYQTWH